MDTMTRSTHRACGWLVAVALCAPGSASAQDSCDVLFEQAAQVMGTAAGKTENLSPTKTSRACTVRSNDGTADLALTIASSPSAARSQSMAKMIAAQSKDPGETLHDESALGPSAFSLRDKDTITFMMADQVRTISLRLTKDRGVTDADVERARQLAKQVLGAK
jgi:hypothetical protein